MNKLIIIFSISLFTISCAKSVYATKVFFKKWEIATNVLYESNSKGDSEIQKIIDFEYTSIYHDIDTVIIKDLPTNLEYQIVQDSVKIIRIDNFDRGYYDLLDLNPSSFSYKNLPDSSKYRLKPLVLTRKYKDKVSGELGTRFLSLSEGINIDIGKAQLESHHSHSYYMIPFFIEHILINETSDTAIVAVSTIYTYEVNQLSTQNGEWRLIKPLHYSIE